MAEHSKIPPLLRLRSLGQPWIQNSPLAAAVLASVRLALPRLLASVRPRPPPLLHECYGVFLQPEEPWLQQGILDFIALSVE